MNRLSEAGFAVNADLGTDSSRMQTVDGHPRSLQPLGELPGEQDIRQPPALLISTSSEL